jgi:hypothetical protein
VLPWPPDSPSPRLILLQLLIYSAETLTTWKVAEALLLRIRRVRWGGSIRPCVPDSLSTAISFSHVAGRVDHVSRWRASSVGYHEFLRSLIDKLRGSDTTAGKYGPHRVKTGSARKYSLLLSSLILCVLLAYQFD